MKTGEVLFIPADDVAKVLTVKDCLKRCEDTFRWVGEGKVDQLSPKGLWWGPPDGPYGWGHALSFPAYIEPLKIVGVKWLGAYRLNRKRGLPPVTAIDIINDAETGMPISILDGTSITAMRTAGHAGVGAKYLARKDSKVITIIGCGLEGRTHLMMMNEIFKIEQVRAFDIVEEAKFRFKEEMSEQLNLNIVPTDSAREAVKGADVICMVTTAKEPLVMEEWIEPGAHVCATTGFMDLDPNCAISFDKWVVGYYGRDLEWIEGEEVGKMSPDSFPYTKKDIYADLSTEIILGKKPSRQSDKERTIMTHLGMPAFDAAVAALVYEKAKEKGIGTVLKVF